MSVIGTKREFHGALARRSPYTTTPVRCALCLTLYDNRCEIAEGATICYRCRWQGWLEPVEYERERRRDET